MCRVSAQDGVTHLVATPHSNYSYTFDPDLNRQLLADLQEKVGESPKLLLGCDFHLSYDNIQTCAQNSKDFTINQTSYLLVELPDQFIPDHITRVYYDIQVAGLKPIITHPERNSLLQRKPDLLELWVSNGCLVQVTAQSYTGGFGSKARKFSEQLLDGGLGPLLCQRCSRCNKAPADSLPMLPQGGKGERRGNRRPAVTKESGSGDQRTPLASPAGLDRQ